MEQLDNIISKQPDKMTAIEYTIWRLWLTSQNNNPKGESNQKTIYDAQRAAQDLARITDERDALIEELESYHSIRDCEAEGRAHRCNTCKVLKSILSV